MTPGSEPEGKIIYITDINGFIVWGEM